MYPAKPGFQVVGVNGGTWLHFFSNWPKMTQLGSFFPKLGDPRSKLAHSESWISQLGSTKVQIESFGMRNFPTGTIWDWIELKEFIDLKENYDIKKNVAQQDVGHQLIIQGWKICKGVKRGSMWGSKFWPTHTGYGVVLQAFGPWHYVAWVGGAV